MYGIFLLFLSSSAYYAYYLLTTKEERKFYRLKLQQEVQERREKIVEKELSTDFQKKIEQANFKRFNAFRFQVFRLLIFLIIAFYYVAIPLSEGKDIRLAILFLLAFVVLTEPRFKYSLINVILNALINQKRKAKIVELFTLFDILKAELYTLNEDQEVNVYNIIKDITPMFSHIQGTLTKFLSLWKRSPGYAKEVFSNEIGGEIASTLGNILYKLDSVTKKDALVLIESESSVFSVKYYQDELKKSTKSNTLYFGFFLTTNILIITWLIVYIFVMFQERFTDTTI